MAQKPQPKPRHVDDPANPSDDNGIFTAGTNGEVRAGPGDAGAQEAPRVLDDARGKPSRSTRILIRGLIVATGILLLLMVVVY